MDSREELVQQQEQLRLKVRALARPIRQQFYQQWEKQVKDPDSYAVLNYLFVAGLHHFYLGKWQRGLCNLSLSLLGLLLLMSTAWLWGLSLFLLVSMLELPALFRAERIVLEHNNKTMQALIEALT